MTGIQRPIDSLRNVFSERWAPLVLAAASACWFWTSSLGATIGWDRSQFRFVADLGSPGSGIPILPVSLSLIGLGSIVYRRRFPHRFAHQNVRPLIGVALGILAAVVVRLLSWWDVAGSLIPWASFLWWGPIDVVIAVVILSRSSLLCALRADGFCAAIPHSAWITPAMLFVVFTTAYGAYALYFCQMTMVHGDEGQYLRVTQSLIDDGDIDLSNNLSPGHTQEFHVMDFGVHKARSSPAGHVYSMHPVGTSALVLPAYLGGKRLWGNPRLGAALLMVLVCAGLVATLYVLSVRFGFSRTDAFITATLIGTTIPVGVHSPQIYPDVPAAFIISVTLCGLSSWFRTGGQHVHWGRWEPMALGLYTLLLAFLPFLHPRLIFPAVGLGGLLIAQAHMGPRRTLNYVVLLACAGTGVIALLAHNIHISSDWLGHLRPGNAMPQDAVNLLNLPVTAIRHWLTGGTGIGNSTPTFFFALVGLCLLVWRRDRRGIAATVLWLATGGVSSLVPYGAEGYTYPGRLMLTSIPALSLCLSAILPWIRARGIGVAMLTASVLLSWESVYRSLPLTELGYHGFHLRYRSINSVYPWEAHFLQPGESIHLVDIAFWLSMLAGISFLLCFNARTLWLRVAPIGLLAVTPYAWGQTETALSRQGVPMPYLGFIRDGKPVTATEVESEVVTRLGNSSRVHGVDRYGVRVEASTQDKLGFLTYYHTPHFLPGTVRLLCKRLTVATKGQVGGALYASQSPTLFVSTPWTTSYRKLVTETNDSDMVMEFPTEGLSVGMAGLE